MEPAEPSKEVFPSAETFGYGLGSFRVKASSLRFKMLQVAADHEDVSRSRHPRFSIIQLQQHMSDRLEHVA